MISDLGHKYSCYFVLVLHHSHICLPALGVDLVLSAKNKTFALVEKSAVLVSSYAFTNLVLDSISSKTDIDHSLIYSTQKKTFHKQPNCYISILLQQTVCREKHHSEFFGKQSGLVKSDTKRIRFSWIEFRCLKVQIKNK